MPRHRHSYLKEQYSTTYKVGKGKLDRHGHDRLYIYMDNVLSGTECDTKAKEYYQKGRGNFKEAGMNLRQ